MDMDKKQRKKACVLCKLDAYNSFLLSLPEDDCEEKKI